MVSKTFGLAALAGLCFAAVAAPAHAGVFEASADGSGGDPFYGDGSAISLPQYAGPGTITSVTLTFNGVARGNQEEYFGYDANAGLMSDGVPKTIFFTVLGPLPAVTGFGGPTSFEFGPVDIPPSPCDPVLGCDPEKFLIVDRDFSVPVSGTASLTDLSDFAGSGSNDFVLFEESGNLDQLLGGVSGTLTETITFTAPEPSTWAMMLMGFAGLGAVGWRSRRVMV